MTNILLNQKARLRHSCKDIQCENIRDTFDLFVKLFSENVNAKYKIAAQAIKYKHEDKFRPSVDTYSATTTLNSSFQDI